MPDCGPSLSFRAEFTRVMSFFAESKVSLVHNVLGPFGGRPVDILQTNEAFRDVFQAWSGCAQHNRKRMHAVCTVA